MQPRWVPRCRVTLVIRRWSTSTLSTKALLLALTHGNENGSVACIPPTWMTDLLHKGRGRPIVPLFPADVARQAPPRVGAPFDACCERTGHTRRAQRRILADMLRAAVLAIA